MDGFLLALLLCREPQINEEAYRPAIVPDKIAHETVQNVVIQL